MKISKLILVSGILCCTALSCFGKDSGTPGGFHWELDLGASLNYKKPLIVGLEDYESLDNNDGRLHLSALAAGGIYYDRLFIESTPLSNRPVTFGLNILKSETRQFNLIAESLFVEISQDKQQTGSLLDGIDTRRVSIEAGVEYYYAFHDIDLRLSYLHDILGRHNGNYGSIELGFPIFTSTVFIQPSISLEYIDDDVADYYFGIRPHEATAGRPEYSAGSAWGTGVRLYMERPIGDRWSVISVLRYHHLSDAIADSPIVSHNDIYSASLGVLWSF